MTTLADFLTADPIAGPRVAVGCVIVREGRVLIGRRIGGVAADTWGVPGGKVEPGETPEAAAVREALEETGLAVQATGKIQDVTSNVIEGTHWLVLYVPCIVVGGALREAEPDKFVDLKWSSFAALHADTTTTWSPSTGTWLNRLFGGHRGE